VLRHLRRLRPLSTENPLEAGVAAILLPTDAEDVGSVARAWPDKNGPSAKPCTEAIQVASFYSQTSGARLASYMEAGKDGNVCTVLNTKRWVKIKNPDSLAMKRVEDGSF
jgi:hypothetical protein